MAASDETIDAELLSVYLEEAGEVLGTIADSLEQAREVPQNMEVLRTIRRGFHTLKGSGRMVGLTRLGEAAWAVEQVMNRWLEEERAATPDLITLIATARQFFEGAVGSLKAGGPSPDESQIVAIAQKVKAGEALGEVTLGMAAPAPAARRPRPRSPPHLWRPRLSPPRLRRPCRAAAPIEFPAIDITAVAPPSAPETVSAPAAAIEIAPAPPEPAAPAEEEETINVGGLALSPALYAIFLEETRTHLGHLGAGQAKLTEGEPVTEDFERSAHTLAGIAGTVRFTAMRELAHGLEEMLERNVGKPADADARSLIGASIDALGVMLTAAEARTLPQPAADLVARLSGAASGATPAAPPAPAVRFARLLAAGGRHRHPRAGGRGRARHRPRRPGLRLADRWPRRGARPGGRTAGRGAAVARLLADDADPRRRHVAERLADGRAGDHRAAGRRARARRPPRH